VKKLKIGRYLAKIWKKYHGLLFSAHPVYETHHRRYATVSSSLPPHSVLKISVLRYWNITAQICYRRKLSWTTRVLSAKRYCKWAKISH